MAPDPRVGDVLHVRGRPLPFSMWPVGRGIRRYGVSDYLFAKSPWAVVQSAIEEGTPRSRRPEALAFLQQARSFFDAAHDRTVAATPLILYYSFMNLAKAFILATLDIDSLDRAMHGLKDDPGAGGQEITGASVVVKTSGDLPSIFPLYAEALGFPVPDPDSIYPVTELMGQSSSVTASGARSAKGSVSSRSTRSASITIRRAGRAMCGCASTSSVVI